MAARRRSKRSHQRREQIREKQAFHSMELALVEYETSTQKQSSSVQRKRIQKSETSFNTALEGQLKKAAKQSSKASKASNHDVPHLPAEPHTWMSKAANQGASDLSWFMLFVVLMFAAIG